MSSRPAWATEGNILPPHIYGRLSCGWTFPGVSLGGPPSTHALLVAGVHALAASLLIVPAIRGPRILNPSPYALAEFCIYALIFTVILKGC